MHYLTVLIVATSILSTAGRPADAPNWLGTFTVDDSCNQAECCCLSEQVTITKVRDVQLSVAANVAGAPCHAQLNGSTSVVVVLPIPQEQGGYQITTSFLGTNNRFTLNRDSQYIANVNLQSPKCSGAAHRVSSNWLGAFAVDDSCSTDECCCLSGSAIITQFSATQLLVSAEVVGRTCPTELKGSIAVPIPIPQDKNGFQITTDFLGTLNRFTLTYDNNFIANVNLQHPQCSGMGRRL